MLQYFVASTRNFTIEDMMEHGKRLEKHSRQYTLEQGKKNAQQNKQSRRYDVGPKIHDVHDDSKLVRFS